MLMLPLIERLRFEKLVRAEADRYGLGVDEYFRKVWYHREAAVVGEYVAMHLADELSALAGRLRPVETEMPNDVVRREGQTTA